MQIPRMYIAQPHFYLQFYMRCEFGVLTFLILTESDNGFLSHLWKTLTQLGIQMQIYFSKNII